MVWDRKEDTWTDADRNDPLLFSQKYIKVPLLSKGKNPLPSFVMAQIGDMLIGLGNAYLEVAKMPEWKQASERARVRQLEAAANRANAALNDLFKIQSGILDEEPRRNLAKEREEDRRTDRAIVMFQDAIRKEAG